MIDDVIKQVEKLMKVQSKVESSSNPYAWLNTRRINIKISRRDEATIRKITGELPGFQICRALSNLNYSIKNHDVTKDDIPKIFIYLLNKENDLYVISKVNEEKRMELHRRLNSGVFNQILKFFHKYLFLDNNK